MAESYQLSPKEAHLINFSWTKRVNESQHESEPEWLRFVNPEESR